MIMSASIFRFPNAKSVGRPKPPPEPFKPTSYYIDFTFGGKSIGQPSAIKTSFVSASSTIVCN